MKDVCFLFIILITLVSCNQSGNLNKTFWVDNPTTSAINVKFDDQDYEIPASSGVIVELSFGKHTMTYNNETIKLVVIPNDQNCVINPTLSTYVFYHEIYSEIGKDIQAKAEYEKIKPSYLYDFELNGDTIKVPFTIIKDKLFIEQYEYFWHLGITEPYKNRISIRKGDSPLATAPQSKLFRIEDFLNYIGKENVPENFTIVPKSSIKLSELPVYEFVPREAFTDCTAEKEDLKKLKSKFDSLQIITDPVRFRNIYWLELSNDMSDIYRKVMTSPTSEKNEKCVEIFKNINKRKPTIGQMNAYIVK